MSAVDIRGWSKGKSGEASPVVRDTSDSAGDDSPCLDGLIHHCHYKRNAGLAGILNVTHEGDTLPHAVMVNGYAPLLWCFEGPSGPVRTCFPVKLDQLAITYLRGGATSEFEIVPPGAFAAYDPSGSYASLVLRDGSLLPLSEMETHRLTDVLTPTYLRHGYITTEHLLPIRYPDGTIGNVYVDDFNCRPGSQISFSCVARDGAEASLRCILPANRLSAIVDEFDNDGQAVKQREIGVGELPLHTLIPEIVAWNQLPPDFISRLPPWLTDQERKTLITDQGFRYRAALSKYGLAIPYDPSSGWGNPFPARVAILGELSQFASNNGRAGFMKMATGLLNPLSRAFRAMGYADSLFKERNTVAALGVSAAISKNGVSKVARALEMFCTKQALLLASMGQVARVARNFGQSEFEFLRLAPPCDECLGSQEEPIVIILRPSLLQRTVSRLR